MKASRLNMSELEITPAQARKEWAKDLRSGEYQQITGQLREGDNGRCCLGVACDTYKRLTEKGYWAKNTFVAEEDSYCSAELPDIVMTFFGFSKSDPELDYGQQATTLNDQQGKTFAEIADLIEKLS